MTDLKRFSAVYLTAGQVRRMTFEAATLEEARTLATGWGAGVEGEAPDSAPVKAPLPEAYDLKTACQLLGNVCERTVWRWITRGELDRVPGVRRVLVTRKSLERLGGRS